MKDPCAQPDMFDCGWKEDPLLNIYMKKNLTKVDLEQNVMTGFDGV